MFDILKRPALFQDVGFKFEDNIYYLYHRSENKVLLLENSVAIEIVSQINGENNIKSIISHIEKEYSDADGTKIKDDTVDFLKILKKENFIIFLK